jgi:RHS repeat-associated protein
MLRATISDLRKMQSNLTQAKVQSYNNYYPFGMLMPGRNASSESYRYGFNGKEMDNDMSGGKTGAVYDYGFRIYDSRITKFLSVDPLTSEYPWYTPYQFAGNMPIWAIDMDGLEEKIVINGEMFDRYRTIVMEATEILIATRLEIKGEKLIKSAKTTLATMEEQGWKSGSNGKLYKTSVMSIIN